MSNDSLGDRMKSYEDAYRISLPIRMPLIIRIDGKAFHSYTKGCQRPVDNNLLNCMNETAAYLCKNIQNVQLAYVQSDEISLLLVNYKELDSQSWFDNNLQKIVSISSALASSYFTSISDKIFGKIKLAQFDARAFVLPKEDVCNYFLWRQQDATRNSVQMLARSLYSHKECDNKNNSELQELCWQKGINWNDCPAFQKRGRCLIKTFKPKTVENPKTLEKITVDRSEWTVDNEIPVFSQNRMYIDNYVYPLKTWKISDEQHTSQHS
jgi:tRNA(His) 5'-end guanylyltransferase